MTLGNAAAARVGLIVWCKACGHRGKPDPTEMASRYGAKTTVPEWRDRLVCSRCGRSIGNKLREPAASRTVGDLIHRDRYHLCNGVSEHPLLLLVGECNRR